MPYLPAEWREEYPHGRIDWTDERIALVQKCIRAGMTLRETAKKVGCGPTTLLTFRARYLPNERFTGKGGPQQPPAHLNLVRKLRADGASHAQIAKQVGRTRSAIAQLCKTYKINKGNRP